MSPKYEEDLSSALGAICEVLTRENHLLFVGRIQEYDRAGGRLCAELRKGEKFTKRKEVLLPILLL